MDIEAFNNSNLNTFPKRIEILGVFGSGKTTIANTLNDNKYIFTALENHLLNPFWGKQEILNTGGDLAYELAFLIQHRSLILSGTIDQPPYIICDWSFFTDKLWASIRLDKGIYKVYEQVHSIIARSVGTASGYLYLDIAPQIIYQQMQKRNRLPELKIEYSLIESACSDLSNIVSSLPKNLVCTIQNTDDINSIKKSFTNFIKIQHDFLG